MAIFKGREELIEAVESDKFYTFTKFDEVVGSVEGQPLKGKPYTEETAKGRVFGMILPVKGKVEIYSHNFNNLTNPFFDFIILR